MNEIMTQIKATSVWLASYTIPLHHRSEHHATETGLHLLMTQIFHYCCQTWRGSAICSYVQVCYWRWTCLTCIMYNTICPSNHLTTLRPFHCDIIVGKKHLGLHEAQSICAPSCNNMTTWWNGSRKYDHLGYMYIGLLNRWKQTCGYHLCRGSVGYAFYIPVTSEASLSHTGIHSTLLYINGGYIRVSQTVNRC